MAPAPGHSYEYLNQILSQRGPHAVAYSEQYKWTIREHLSELLKTFPSLSVEPSEFHTNDGRMHHLVKAEGTIPIVYQSHKYNIPIRLWLPELYPNQPPLCYVTPTPNMVIKQGHRFVDPSGQVHAPAMLSWLPSQSDLVATVAEMTILFGQDPPLYSKPPVPQQSPQFHNSPNHHSPSQTMAYPPAATTFNPLQTTQPPQGYPAPMATYPPSPGPGMPDANIWGQQQYSGSYPQAGPMPGYPASSSAVHTPTPPPPRPDTTTQRQELERTFKEAAMRALQERLRQSQVAYQRSATEEMDKVLAVQQHLESRARDLDQVLQQIQRERSGTEGLVTELALRTSQLQKWLDDNERKAQQADLQKVDIHQVVVPSDPLSNQAMQCQAEDLAVEDVLLTLDKALGKGKVALTDYLKQVRSLCRKQFFSRARGLKVAAQQERTPPANNLGGGPAYNMTQGDSWVYPLPGAALANPLAVER